MPDLHQLDAIELQCPDFAYPVREFLNGIPDGESGHIVTKEPKADVRLIHICNVYDWQLKGPVIQDECFHFIVTKPNKELSNQ